MKFYIKSGEDDIFTFYHNASFLENQKQKLNFFGNQSSSASSSDSGDVSIYKLHITLAQDDYVQHRDKIAELILPFVSDKTIPLFKCANPDILNKEIEEIRAEINRWEDEYIEYEAVPSRVQRTIEKLEDDILHAERFLSSDQFTIYIGARFNAEKLLALCEVLDDYIQQHQLKRSDFYDVESPITHNISLRQTHINDDALRLAAGEDMREEKIETIPFVGYGNDEAKRAKIKLEQDESELFRFLVKGLAMKPLNNNLNK